MWGQPGGCEGLRICADGDGGQKGADEVTELATQHGFIEARDLAKGMQPEVMEALHQIRGEDAAWIDRGEQSDRQALQEGRRLCGG